MSKKNNSTGLSLELKRKVRVKRYPVIAKLTLRKPRPDLVSLLTTAKAHPDGLPARLSAYLSKEQLWDKDTQSITAKGESVLDTGLYDADERALYHIWYINGDPLLGSRPILIQRDTAFFEPETKGWLKGIDAENSDFSVDGDTQLTVLDEIYDGHKSRQQQIELTLARLKPEVICAADKEDYLELNWELSHLKSELNFFGQLDVMQFKQGKGQSQNKPEKLEFSINAYGEQLVSIMNNVAGEFKGEWLNEHSCLAAPFDNVKNYPGAIANFKVGSKNLNGLKMACGTFDSVLVKHIPVRPIDEADAKLWHASWLQGFHEKSYQAYEQARRQQSRWLDNPAMAGFELGLKEGVGLLTQLSREQQPDTYWHVAAMADLTPSKSKKLRMPLTLADGDELQLDELIDYLTAGENVEQMILSDRYVHNKKQSRNLAAIADCLHGAEGFLWTQGRFQGQEAVLPEHWQREIFKKEHANHGRFWIFVCESNLYCWECSSGIDFITQNENGCAVAGVPCFTPKEPSELPVYLQQAVEKMQSMEMA